MAYRHGEFTWFENVTQNEEASVAFYTSVFGWTIQEVPMPGGTYRIVQNGERGIGGIMTPPVPDGVPAPPPHWSHYLSVPDVDAAMATIVAEGGQAITEAIDIPGVGRMAVVSDAQGAVLHVWKGLTEDPAKYDEVDDMQWSELWSPDPEAAVAFYSKTFGLGGQVMEMDQGPYHLLASSEESMLGGVMQHPAEGMPPAWVAYVRVADADATAARVKELGGSIMMPPMDVDGVGRFFVFTDPEGALLGAITPSSPA